MASSDTTALLQQAVALHQQGKLDAALGLYSQVLAAQPNQFDALHLSGVIARQHGNPARAVELIGRAIDADPGKAAAHCNLGAALQDLNRPKDALASYDQAIALNPRYSMAFNNRGNALKNLGRSDEALLSYATAIDILPTYAEAFSNQGILLQTLQRYDAALASFDRALKLNGKHLEAACGRAAVLHSLQRHIDAVYAYDHAISLKPGNAATHCGLGASLYRLQQYPSALDSFERALQRKPDFAQAHQFRANTLRMLEQPDAAIQAYRTALACGGDAAQINYALAAMGAGETPPAAPVDYVTDLFDQYAGHFDQHLLEVLNYDTPRLLAEAIADYLPADPVDTLDLGCGTGLFGPYLRPYASRLTGVDLSPNMLGHAAQRACYDELACAELVAYLADRPDRYGLIVAADVFVYIGDLDPVFRAVQAALRPGGIFSFSVEEHLGPGFILRESSRYAHSADYLDQLAKRHGLQLRQLERCITRQDRGADVGACLLVMTRTCI